MKTIRLFFACMFLIQVVSCNAQSGNNEKSNASSGKIEAYYFHFTARCMTCRTVEEQAKANIETLYPELLKQGKISFQSINLDDESSKIIAEKLNVSGQTLIIVKGDQIINITNEGFMYAVHQPEKFQTIMKEKIDSLL
jgi:hypothetical protein